VEGLGRLVAADMIGLDGSDKLSPSGPDGYGYGYGYGEQRDYLFSLWDALDLGDNVILVLHDWGSVVGFDWACRHRDRVRGIAFMEGIVARPPEYLRNDPECQRIIRHFFAEDKPVAHLCHGPLIAAAAGVLSGRRSAAYPALAPDVAAVGAQYEDGAAVVDGMLVSGRA
jgi:pimeloyl-ACP methyl ester carboxylesterase